LPLAPERGIYAASLNEPEDASVGALGPAQNPPVKRHKCRAPAAEY